MKITILVVLALTMGVASADPKQEARKHVETADVQYKLGQFDKALAEYSAAYELYAVPALLFNIGQCHKNLKNYEQALFFYRGFLRDSPADAPNRNVVEDLIRETQADLDRQRAEAEAAKKAADAEQQRRDEEAARQRIAEEQRIAAARQQVEVKAAPAEQPIYQKWWFWPVVGGAALAVGGGVYFATSSTTLIPPSGTLGGLDRR